MVRRSIVLLIIVFGIMVAPEAVLGADTPAAKFTRTRKLDAKVTLDFKEEMLHIIFDDIDGQLRDQNLSGLSVRFETGVSRNQRLSYTCKDKPLREALDEMLKVNKLGYVVISKVGDRYDGWLEITRDELRGYRKGEEPKADKVTNTQPMTATPEPMTEPEPKEEPKTAERPQHDRMEMLNRISLQHFELAQLYLDTNNRAKAIKKLEYIAELYPETEAGQASKQLLEELR